MNRLILINERKVKLKQKSDQKSRSGIIAENPRKIKTDEQFKSEYRNKVIAATLKAAGFQYLLGFGANNPFVWASKKQAPNLNMTNSQFSGPASENFKLWPTLNDIEPDPSLVNSIYRPRGLRN